MTTEEFIEYLKKQQGDQTQEEFATQIGVSPAYLSDVYNNRKEAGDKITSAVNAETFRRLHHKTSKEMAMKKVLISFIQDRSGSMQSVWEETLNGFKTYVEGLQEDQKKDNEIEYLFSLTTFDTLIEAPYVGKPINDVSSEELKTHGPRGMTALYDAVGKTLQAHDDDKTLTFEKAIVVIVTDGQENSSREWSKDALHAAIDERIKRGNWTFTYLGTQPETWDDAQSLGVAAGANAIYNAQNAGATYATMSAATANMARSVRGQSVNFLHENTTRAGRASVGMRTSLDASRGTAVKTPRRAVPRIAPKPPAAKNRKWRDK